MNGMIHNLPTADLPWQNKLYNGQYDGSAPFSLMLMMADLLDGKPAPADYMSRYTFDSLPVYAAFMGAGWAVVYRSKS